MDPLFALTIALLLAALFAGSAVHKLIAWNEWQGVAQNYRLIPPGIGPFMAGLIPCAELLASALLVMPRERPLGGTIAAGLLWLYGSAMAINVLRGRTNIDCGCFGSRLAHGISAWMVVRNAVMGTVALTLCMSVTRRPLSVPEELLAVVLVITIGFLYPVLTVVLQPPPPRYDDNFRRTAPRIAA
jgi:hypothetical protein